MELEQIREQLPQLAEKVYGKRLVYLDNAATSLRPQCVIDKWNEMSSRFNSNLHRAVHHIAAVATEEYESTRDCVKEFLNARYREEIIFTSGATASLNLVAYSFGERFVAAGDEIIIAESEHHSDIVPWQLLCERKGASIKVLPVDENGELRLDMLEEMISEKTRIVCVAHISNVLGIVNPVRKITEICHSKGCKVLIDGAQGIVHSDVDVQEIGCDFYAFSGHKIYAAPGTGVLYGRKELLDQMPPYMGGGEMISTVNWEKTTYAPLPQKFEAGTQNISGTPTLKPAIEFAKLLKNNKLEETNIKDFVLSSLLSDPDIQLYGVPTEFSDKIPVFSFSVKGAHHEDLALIMDKMGIALRSGQMCAEPLMDRFAVTGMLRASFAPYNTMEEAEYFINCLYRAIDMLR